MQHWESTPGTECWLMMCLKAQTICLSHQNIKPTGIAGILLLDKSWIIYVYLVWNAVISCVCCVHVNYRFMCVHAWMHVPMFVCIETRGKLWVSFLRDAIYFIIWDRCLLDLEPTKYIRLAGHWTQDIPLTPLPWCWDYKYMIFYFLCGI